MKVDDTVWRLHPRVLPTVRDYEHQALGPAPPYLSLNRGKRSVLPRPGKRLARGACGPGRALRLGLDVFAPACSTARVSATSGCARHPRSLCAITATARRPLHPAAGHRLNTSAGLSAALTGPRDPAGAVLRSYRRLGGRPEAVLRSVAALPARRRSGEGQMGLHLDCRRCPLLAAMVAGRYFL